MPRSKRNKQVELAKTKKRGLEWKKNLFEQVRSCVDSYANVFVFSVNDMRNSKMKNVREQWKDSRFFIGKNKIMAMALGKNAEDEYKPNLHKIGQQVKGQCGLLFSNKCTEEILSWFRSYSEGDYARSGNTATEDVMLKAGPLPMFPHSLEPYLRQLGLPTSLVKGVIHLVKDHEVCKDGNVLTPETAKILKLLGYEMAEFHIAINCVWSQDGSFMQFIENVNTEAKENVKKKKVSSQVKDEDVSKPSTMEEMEVEINEESDSGEPETENVTCTTSPSKMDEVDTLPVKVLSNDMTNTSTPKEKSKEFMESTPKIQQVSIVESTPKIQQDSIVVESTPKIQQDSIVVESTPKIQQDSIVIESAPKIQQDSIVITEKSEDTEPPIDTSSKPKKKKKEKASEEEDEKVDNKQKSRKRKVKIAAKKESLQNTPDIANSSQESPVFRELRNRSVKVTRKKNK